MAYSCRAYPSAVQFNATSGHGVMVTHQPSKLLLRVRIPLPAPPPGPVAQRQSSRLITGRSQVRILSGPQTSPEKGFCCTPRATAQWFNLLLSSPPRVWGKLPAQAVTRNSHRFTPTRVGKTAPTARSAARASGSPPRVWGKLEAQARKRQVERFTPTRVWKTSG